MLLNHTEGNAMDPNANFIEQAEIFARAPYSDHDQARLRELQDAYADWRAMGGFPASRAAKDRLVAAVKNAGRSC